MKSTCSCNRENRKFPSFQCGLILKYVYIFGGMASYAHTDVADISKYFLLVIFQCSYGTIWLGSKCIAGLCFTLNVMHGCDFLLLFA